MKLVPARVVFACIGLTFISLILSGQTKGEALNENLPIAVWKHEAENVEVAPQLVEWLTAAGCQVSFLDTDDLADADKLNPEKYEMLVVPYGEIYSASGMEVLKEYLKGGGTVFQFGGRGFSRHLFRSGDAKVSIEDLAAAQDSIVIGDFVDGKPWELTNSDSPGKMQVSVVSEEDGKILRFESPMTSGWQYTGRRLSKIPPENSLLTFRARGDIHYLCIEIRGAAASRWKAVFKLEPGWKKYMIHLAEFASYATKDRGVPMDPLKPEELDAIWFGYIRSMADSGKHWFEIDDVRLVEFPTDNIPVALNDVDPAKFFSDIIHSSPEALPFYVDSREVAGGWTINAPVRGSTPQGRIAPLVKNDDGDILGGIFLGTADPYRGMRAALFGTQFPPPGMDGKALTETIVQQLLRMPAIAEVKRKFTVKPPLTMDVDVELMGLPRRESATELTAKLSSGEDMEVVKEVQASAQVPPGGKEEVQFEIGSDKVDWFRYSLSVSHSKEGGAMDEITMDIDVKQCFRQFCDWLCEKQEDGKFSGVSFQDQRAVRGLLIAYEVFGDEKYLKAGMAWGETMIKEQRKDGGYRMGYGIRTDGQEACYVADGGEICIGIIVLYPYTKGDSRARFRQSIDNYMKYRGSFRNENGGIGIGWTFTDYLAKPYVTKENTYREMRHLSFTIGCTLASAAAYTAITGNSEDIEQAIKDTRRLMKEANTMIGGAYPESLCWAHHYIEDAELRAEIESYMKERWIPYITNPNRKWWLEGGGRTVLGLDSLTYYYEVIEKSPEVMAAMVRATSALCGPDLPASVKALMAQSSRSHEQWRYLCFATVSLGDVVRPNTSLPEF